MRAIRPATPRSSVAQNGCVSAGAQIEELGPEPGHLPVLLVGIAGAVGFGGLVSAVQLLACLPSPASARPTTVVQVIRSL